MAVLILLLEVGARRRAEIPRKFFSRWSLSVSSFCRSSMDSSSVTSTDKGDAIKVYCRVRPDSCHHSLAASSISIASSQTLVPSTQQQQQNRTAGSLKNVTRVEDSSRVLVGKHSFAFDFAAGPETGQEEIFDKICKPLATSFLSGLVWFRMVGQSGGHTLRSWLPSPFSGH